jgi:hypothetical protein
MTPKISTFCVGCGRHVIDMTPGQVLAISCICGAMAPILVNDDLRAADHLSFPASLVLAQRAGKPPAHLEYYLGFSDHESEMKALALAMLQERGSISQSECDEEGCKAAFERSRQRHLETEHRRAGRETNGARPR